MNLPAARHAAAASLRNLGPRSAQMLAAVGIATLGQLRRTGAVAAFVKARRADPGASLNLLYALVGALESVDWRIVQRERRLQLLIAVEDYERTHPMRRAQDDELLALRNIGPAMRRDLEQLGIRSRRQLARTSADALYARLQRITGQRQDPCVWDTFAAAIHQSRTGEALPWWHFTGERKAREAAGDFVSAPAAKPGRASNRARSPGQKKKNRT